MNHFEQKYVKILEEDYMALKQELEEMKKVDSVLRSKRLEEELHEYKIEVKELKEELENKKQKVIEMSEALNEIGRIAIANE